MSDYAVRNYGACYWCGRGRCICEEDEDPIPDTMDARDATKKPPAYLDPKWILRMRRRLDRFKKTGRVDWMKNPQGKVAQ